MRRKALYQKPVKRTRFCCVCGREGTFPGNLCPECTPVESVGPAPSTGVVKHEMARLCPECGRVQFHSEEPFIEAEWPKVYKKRYCEDCGRMRSNRITAIVQVRSPRPLTDDQVEHVAQSLSSVQWTRYRAKEVAGGVDFYFLEHSDATNAGRRITMRLGGLMTSTRTLVTQDRQTGKGLYQITVLVRLPDARPGELVRIDAGIGRLVSMGSNGALVRDLATRDTFRLTRKQAATLKLVPEDTVHEAMVSAVSPGDVFVTLMDTYETLTIPLPPGPSPREGEQVQVVMDGARPLLVF